MVIFADFSCSNDNVRIWDLNESKNHIEPEPPKLPIIDINSIFNKPIDFNQDIFPIQLPLKHQPLASSPSSAIKRKKDDVDLDVPNVGFTIIPGHQGAVISSAGFFFLMI
jgi:hypothetical protein